MSDKKKVPDYLKKSKTEIGVKPGIYDDEFVTIPKLGFSVKKGKTEVNISGNKPLSKVDKRNINSALTLGITKGDIEKGDTSEFSLLGTKQGKSKNLEVVFKKVLGKILGDAGNIIDEVVTTKEEKMKLKNEIKKMPDLNRAEVLILSFLILPSIASNSFHACGPNERLKYCFNS